MKQTYTMEKKEFQQLRIPKLKPDDLYDRVAHMKHIFFLNENKIDTVLIGICVLFFFHCLYRLFQVVRWLNATIQ